MRKAIKFSGHSGTKYAFLTCMIMACITGTGSADSALIKGDIVIGMEQRVAMEHSSQLRQRLMKALKRKGPDYHPRTKHVSEDGTPLFTNRLLLEDSPYLLQHAHNPVDWYPWGPDAFAAARRTGKLIFLSIGYSSCHWCHVMEEECFEDLEIARLLNSHFISIKVDRECRPEIDATYMTAVMIIAGNGGWPMSVFLLPDGRPFYGGTYFPQNQFKRLLEQIHSLWQQRRNDLVAQAEQVALRMQELLDTKSQVEEINASVIHRGMTEAVDRYDAQYGGFDRVPKFPNEPLLLFLLEQVQRNPSKRVLEIIETTLKSMAYGGIYDQIGGGFHRYSTDPAWQIPHFEKMLYNQAHLARIYTRAYNLTGKRLYARVAEQTLDYVLSEMGSPEGGFYSATDADSGGEEGAYFTWSIDEVKAVLDPQLADLATRLYGMTPQGNFNGKNVLHMPKSFTAFAELNHISLGDLLAGTDTIRNRLYRARQQRTAPECDNKIITAWNAMMITTLAEASSVLGKPRYLIAAEKAADFLWSYQRRNQTDLWRVRYQARSSVPAGQEDYAYLALAMVSLYDAGRGDVWLKRSRMIVDRMVELFWDADSGGFFMSVSPTDMPRIARVKDGRDGAMPSGNSAALKVLAMLAERTGSDRYQQNAEKILAAFSSELREHPDTFAVMMAAADSLFHGEVSNLRYGARGAVKVTARVVNDKAGRGQLKINLDLHPGWHINAHETADPDLVPTSIELVGSPSGWLLESPNYPEGRLKSLSFSDKPIPVYEGKVELRASIRIRDNKVPLICMLPLRVRFQACSDQTCLPPENLDLRVSANQWLDNIFE